MAKTSDDDVARSVAANSPVSADVNVEEAAVDEGKADADLPSVMPTRDADAEEAAVDEGKADADPPSVTSTRDAEKAQKSESNILPDFTIARATSDGLLTIVGTAAPGEIIVIKANGQILGKAKPTQSGEWVFVPDSKLPPGGVEITVESHNAKGEINSAGKSEIVIVYEGGDRTPLVIASVPGEASAILQGLKAAENKVAAVVTKPEPVAGTNKSAQLANAEKTSKTSDVASATGNKTSDDGISETGEADTGVRVAKGAGDNETKRQEAVVAGKSADLVAGESTDVAEAPQATQESVKSAVLGDSAGSGSSSDAGNKAADITVETKAQVVGAQQTQTQTASADAVQTVMDAIDSFVQPTIDAIEIDGKRNFIAGSGPAGSVMRLYVDNKYIDDAPVRDGRWLVESENVLKYGSQRVRVDVISGDSAEVISRAEVDFVVAIPERTEVARNDESTAQQSAAASTSTASESTAVGDQGEVAAIDNNMDISAEIADTEERIAASTIEEQPLAAVENAESKPDIGDAGAVEADSAVAGDASGEAIGQASAKIGAHESDSNVDTVTAIAIGQGEGERFAFGKAIIRRGDNLWTIARRVYGKGVKYTTIYEANSSQIADPHWIFPGQVFVLPESAN